MNKKLQPLLDYVEGKVPVTVFKQLFDTDKSLENLLSKKLSSKYGFLREYSYNLYNYLKMEYDFKNRQWDCILMRRKLQEVLCAYLENENIPFDEYPLYKEDYLFLLNIQPDWIDCQDDSILQPIIDSIPKDLSKTKRIAMGKEKIRALFKYDKTYPRWVQGAEWPIKNGKPLVFSHQKKAGCGDIRTYYYFYDLDTKEETIVEQFD